MRGSQTASEMSDCRPKAAVGHPPVDPGLRESTGRLRDLNFVHWFFSTFNDLAVTHVKNKVN